MGECRDVNGFLFFREFGVKGVVVPEFNSDVETRCTRTKASRSSESVWWSNASRFERTVPEKRTGSWGMIARRERRECRFICEMSRPSMCMDPCLASKNLNSASVKEDLPAPVRPTMPIRSLRSTRNVRPFSTGGKSPA
jgi:hypothetical protein